MLKMVIKNPTLVTIVSAEPTNCFGAYIATNAENCGESPATTTPQKRKKTRNNSSGAVKINGDSAQHIPEASN